MDGEYSNNKNSPKQDFSDYEEFKMEPGKRDYHKYHSRNNSLNQYQKYSKPKNLSDKSMRIRCQDYENSNMKPKECWNYYDPNRENRNKYFKNLNNTNRKYIDLDKYKR